MKIQWRKTSDPNFIDGYVGKVCCFQVHREMRTKLTLICDLPHIQDDMYGRLVVNCTSPKEATRYAQTTLDSWLERFHHA